MNNNIEGDVCILGGVIEGNIIRYVTVDASVCGYVNCCQVMVDEKSLRSFLHKKRKWVDVSIYIRDLYDLRPDISIDIKLRPKSLDCKLEILIDEKLGSVRDFDSSTMYLLMYIEAAKSAEVYRKTINNLSVRGIKCSNTQQNN